MEKGEKLDTVRVTDTTKNLRLLTVVVIIALALACVLQLQVFWLTWNEQVSVLIANAKVFRVAAYEQKLVNVDNATTREEALVAIRGNLANMEKHAEIASEMGAKVTVFAEYGITGDMGTHLMERSSVYPYMEQIPDVSKSQPACISCDGIDPTREGQTTICCMARKHGMYVLANLIESVPCNSEQDSLCPLDGHYQYNTNIVYDPKGCLIAKYHKYHRYSEELVRLDKPSQPEFVFFDTEFGRFGTMICMDSIFKQPGIVLVERYDIDHMLFPTYWESDSAFELAVSWQLAFATLTNINFVGANIHSAEDNVYGSSILSGSTVINSTSDYKSPQGRLIIGDLPIQKPVKRFQNPEEDSNSADDSSENDGIGAVVIDGDEYNVTALKDLAGSSKICSGQICCFVDYVRNTTKEMFIVGVFSGLHTLQVQMAQEVCLVHKCGNESLSSCGDREFVSATAFSYLKLSAEFNVKYIYPNMAPSELNFQHLNWSFQYSGTNKYSSIISSSEWPLVSTALVGRDFQNDPSE